MKYSGADWIQKDLGVTPSPFGAEVADMLGLVFVGIYHLDTSALRRAEWGHPDYVLVKLSPSRELATFDFDHLTTLCVLAHDRCIRFSVRASMNRLELLFHKRQREGGRMLRHPSIEDAIADVRSAWSAMEAG